jgi:hypothetical protein
MAAAAAGFLVLGGTGWLVREWHQALGPAPMAPAPGQRAVPAPPPQGAWVSPLQPSCAVHDISQRQRLQRLMAQVRATPVQVRVDPSNYGDRFGRDAFGNAINPQPQVVVLHETVYGIQSAINTFQTRHDADSEQVSYHALIGEDGRVVKLVDPSKRAFGAGNSAFQGQWVVTNPKVGGSVNNFALHVSLETPLDGENDNPGHSGYRTAQYDALAALLADWMERFKIPPQNITTHRAVDLGGERADPRSFDWQALQERLQDLGLLC